MSRGRITRARFVLGAFLAFILVAPLVLLEFHVTLLNYIGLYSIVALGRCCSPGLAG